MIHDDIVMMFGRNRFNDSNVYRAPEFGNRPMVYVYDSYLTKAEEWRRLLHPEGDITIRNTPLDVAMIGLWVQQADSLSLLNGLLARTFAVFFFAMITLLYAPPARQAVYIHPITQIS